VIWLYLFIFLLALVGLFTVALDFLRGAHGRILGPLATFLLSGYIAIVALSWIFRHDGVRLGEDPRPLAPWASVPDQGYLEKSTGSSPEVPGRESPSESPLSRNDLSDGLAFLLFLIAYLSNRRGRRQTACFLKTLQRENRDLRSTLGRRVDREGRADS
jgi:hypothetical protein